MTSKQGSNPLLTIFGCNNIAIMSASGSIGSLVIDDNDPFYIQKPSLQENKVSVFHVEQIFKYQRVLNPGYWPLVKL